MAITSIFAKPVPKFGVDGEWITFDAVIEDSLEFTVDYTQFPIEIGADASDHGIIRPHTQVMTISTSNNPFAFSLAGSAVGFVSNFVDSGLGAVAAGLSAGFLEGASEPRAKGMLDFFVKIMYSRTPFDVDSVDYLSKNMVITKLRRTRNVSNENGLMLIVEMQELPLLSTTISNNEPDIAELNDDDPSQSQSVSEKSFGEVLGEALDEAADAVVKSIADISDALTGAE